jgi:hypothetical protein
MAPSKLNWPFRRRSRSLSGKADNTTEQVSREGGTKAIPHSIADRPTHPESRPVPDALPPPAGVDPESNRLQPAAPSFAIHQATALSTSQRPWNDAYEGLEKDGDTAELVKGL